MNQALKEKIDEVVKAVHKGEREEADRLTKEMFAIPATPEEKHEAGQYLTKALTKRKREDVQPLPILGDMTEALSLRYIAEHYFGKGASWLYQRLNQYTVNGKTAAFTEKELSELADAFDDMGERLKEISKHIKSSI